MTLLLLGGAGWYAWQFSVHPEPAAPPPETTKAGRAPEPAVPLPQQASVSLHDVARVKPPPFTVPLPAPLSDADRLKLLADAYESGKTDTPDTAMAKAMLQTPAARGAAQWLLARSGTPLSVQWYRNFQKTYPDWPMTAAMRRRAEIALLTGQSPDAEKKAYFAADPPETSTGRIYWARALLGDGKAKEALDVLRPVWRQERLLPATEQQLRDDFAKLLTVEDHRARMIMLMAGKNWDAAQRAAKDAGPGAEAIVKAYMAAAQGAKTAQAQLDAVSKENQDDPLISYARLLMLIRQDKPRDAASLIGKLAEGGGGKESRNLSGIECRNWRTQQRIVIRKLLDDNAYDDAYRAASAHISKLGCIHSDADFLAGWIALRFSGKSEQAGSHFDTLAANAENASQKARAAYWQGRAAESRGDGASAAAAYERAANQWATFYGQLAAEKLPAALPSQPRSIVVPAKIRSSFEAMTPVRALRLLGGSETQDIAIVLYGDLASTLPDEPHLEALAALAEEQRNPRALLSITRIAARRGFDLGVRAYPTFGLPDVRDARRTVETPLIYAIAHQESAFNPKAKSRAGALGLMQLMPDTARSTAQRSGVAFDLSRLTSDPAYNTGLGAAHLKDLLSDWNGSLILSMAAYNAGGGNVKKWIAAHGDPRSPEVDAIDWIERIPFYETRHYVQRISENLMIYRRLMDSRQPSLFAREISSSGTPVPIPPQRNATP